MSPSLVLLYGSRVVPLAGRPVAVGRLPECDIALEGREVSRRHARIVPTPRGPLLVDRSRFGTCLNGSQVVAPVLLHPGDVILVGRDELRVDLAERYPGPPAARDARWERLHEWRRRYGWSEAVGALAAVAAALWVRRASHSLVAAAYAGTFAETVWFYAVLVLRDLRRESRSPGFTGGAGEILGRVTRNLALEFGVAEAVDSLLLRPLCLVLGLRLLDGWLGVLAGKLAADVVFYGPVLALFHWRLARRREDPRDGDRRRPTTGARPLPE
jgi:hypothetical protein